jgi:adenylate kinase family enzyme
MRRIAIIGSGGAGKSTLARTLGEILGLPVIHLDKEYWKPGWIEPPKDEWVRTVEELVKRDEWIIDGNFGGTMEIRLAAADTVIFLDFPSTICLRRVIKRRLMHWNTNRPDMAEGCNEKIDLEFLGWVWNFRKTTKPEIEKRLLKLDKSVRIVRLRTPSATKAFLAEVTKSSI